MVDTAIEYDRRRFNLCHRINAGGNASHAGASGLWAGDVGGNSRIGIRSITHTSGKSDMKSSISGSAGVVCLWRHGHKVVVISNAGPGQHDDGV